jgi:ribonuclease D
MEFMSEQTAQAALWVDSEVLLERALSDIRSAPLLALDTEFVRRSTYYAELGLVQIATPSAIYLIDPTQKYSGAPLAQALAASTAVKILHSVGEDLEVLRDVYLAPLGLTLSGPIFDTQVAATLAGVGNMLSLAKLVQSLLGQTLDKSETTSNWLARPLSAAQLEYAAEDVRVLLPIYEKLMQTLVQKQRADWVLEDCQRALDKSLIDTPELQPHHRHKGAIKLSNEAQRKLWRLLRWREVKARARNLPKNWVVPIEFAFAASETQFLDEPHFQRALAAQAPKITKRGPDLWRALHDDSNDSTFEPVPHALQGAALARYKNLREHADSLAASLEVPPEVLANRRCLEQLAQDLPAVELNGWRGPYLRALGVSAS